MTAAVVALAAALAVALAVIAFLALRHDSAKTDAADARVHEAELAGQLQVALADVQTQTDRGDAEKRRADALDDLIDELAADAGPAGARVRVLARYLRAARAAASTDGAGARALPAGPAAAADPGGDRDALLRPGD